MISQYVAQVLLLGEERAYKAYQQVYGSTHVQAEDETNLEYVRRCAEQDYEDGALGAAVFQTTYDNLQRVKPMNVDFLHIIMEAARMALADAENFDLLAEKLDMPTPALSRIRENLQDYLNGQGERLTLSVPRFNPETQIAIVWSVEDVQQQNNGLTEEQAFEVLKHMENRHDCNYGITWDTIDMWIQDLFPDVVHNPDLED